MARLSPFPRLPKLSRALLSLAGLTCVTSLAGPQLQAVEGPSASYEAAIDELRAMVEDPRETDGFELDFKPLEMDRILIKDKLGNEHVFHYITFRLRNRVSDSAEYLATHASRYNEVLDTIVEEYEAATKVTEGGAGLVIDDVEAIEDERMATILEREDLRVKKRTMQITALVTDERGTRFRLFDKVPGEGPQERFNFDDRGTVVNPGNFFEIVREAIEEKQRQRLYTVHEIRELELPPYDASKPSSFADGFGMTQGEINGVLIFDRLNIYGNKFNIEIQGLSNKTRFHWPEEKAPGDGEVEDFYNLKVSRRSYVMEVNRPGDEYFRDRDDFTVAWQGWKWVDSFQRLENRATMAYTRYFLNNIRLLEEASEQQSYEYTIDDENGSPKTVTETTDVPVLHDTNVAGQLWTYYNDIRSQYPQRYDAKIAAHAERSDDVLNSYNPPVDPSKYTEWEVKRLQDERGAWEAVLQQYRDVLRDRKNNLDSTLFDWEEQTRNKAGE